MQAASVPQKLQASLLWYMEKEEQANISKEPVQKGHGTVTLLFMYSKLEEQCFIAFPNTERIFEEKLFLTNFEVLGNIS